MIGHRQRKRPFLLTATVFLLVFQLSCAGGGTAIRPSQFPARDSGCELRGVRPGEKVRVRMNDGRTLSGLFLRVACEEAAGPSLQFVHPSAAGDPWDRPDTQSVAFSSVHEIRLGESTGVKAAYAVTIGVIALLVLLGIALHGQGMWGPSS